jgi:hypothetical protein
MILSFPSPFTIRKLAYIALERLNNLEISLGRLRICLLQLRICPRIMAGLRDSSSTAFQE